MDLGLKGKIAVVTGATANIGRAIALELARAGAKVLAVGRDPEAGARVVADALAAGADGAAFLALDLTAPDAGEVVRRAALDAFGEVDVLVNNVGGNAALALFAESEAAHWRHDIEINLMTMLCVTHALLPGMIDRKSGSIVNMGSTSGISGDYLLSTYAAAKGAVHAWTKALAHEVGPHGIRVNCVAPYATMPAGVEDLSRGSRFHPETGFFARCAGNITPEASARMTRTGVLPRASAQPREVASAVAYLASARAGFVTGQVLIVDGGALL